MRELDTEQSIAGKAIPREPNAGLAFLDKPLVAQPFFDLVILGMGEDGHTAGLFHAPDQRYIPEHIHNFVLLTEAPQEPKHRMTLAPALLAAAAN